MTLAFAPPHRALLHLPPDHGPVDFLSLPEWKLCVEKDFSLFPSLLYLQQGQGLRSDTKYRVRERGWLAQPCSLLRPTFLP